jgi:hypothetical protein
MPYLEMHLEHAKISSYSVNASEGDTFDFGLQDGQAPREPGTPSIGELVMTKHTDDTGIGGFIGEGPTGPVPIELENVKITSYQLGVLDNNASGDGDVDGMDFLVWQRNVGTSGDKPAEFNLALGSEPPATFDLIGYAPADDWGLI